METNYLHYTSIYKEGRKWNNVRTLNITKLDLNVTQTMSSQTINDAV